MAKTIRDVMTPDPVCLRENATVAEAARQMSDSDIGDVLIKDSRGLRGMLTDRDIVVRAVAAGRDPNTTTVSEILSADPICASPDDDVSTAVDLMRRHALRRLPVCEGDQLMGIVSIGDLAIEQDSRSALADISAAPANH
ncbi:MAG TPA: CBS domain-containing protein [Candidatus Limnocylindrales bacterium]|nr:CBS domain-containing protein [Candidatus Limnocylindrales bacterium]